MQEEDESLVDSFEVKITVDNSQMKADSAKSSDEKFEEMLDRYYTKVDEDDSQHDEQLDPTND